MKIHLLRETGCERCLSIALPDQSRFIDAPVDRLPPTKLFGPMSARRQWRPRSDGDQRRASAVRIAALVLETEGLVPAHRDELLSIAIWKYTEADGKYSTRYRSEGALEETSISNLNHEHVWPRKWLRERLLAEPDRCDEIMAMAVACVVTRDEHRRLTEASKLDPSLEGWARYEAAGIGVIDLRTKTFLVSAREPS